MDSAEYSVLARAPSNDSNQFLVWSLF